MTAAFPLALFAAALQTTATWVAPRGVSLKPHPVDWTASVLLGLVALAVGAGWTDPVGPWIEWAAVLVLAAAAVARASRASGGLIDRPLWVAAPAMAIGYLAAALLRRVTGLLSPWAATLVALILAFLVVVALHDRDAASRGAGLPLQRGQRVGEHYVIQSLLAKGQLAVTFLARDRRRRETVVIKQFLQPGATTTATSQAEIDALEAIGHRNVVAMLDSFATPAGPCIVLEYVEGGDVAARITKTGPLDRQAFARVASGLMSAIGAAHKAGLVHGDVKPSNLLLKADGSAKLSDFDISWSVEDATMAPGGGAQHVDIGTLRYMAPEQAAHRLRPTPSGDLWGAAATLYEAWTGTPYVPRLPSEPLPRLRERVAALEAFDRALVAPGAMADWFAKALAPEASDRFGDADASAAALLAALPPGSGS